MPRNCMIEFIFTDHNPIPESIGDDSDDLSLCLSPVFLRNRFTMQAPIQQRLPLARFRQGKRTRSAALEVQIEEVKPKCAIGRQKGLKKHGLPRRARPKQELLNLGLIYPVCYQLINILGKSRLRKLQYVTFLRTYWILRAYAQNRRIPAPQGHSARRV